jgi:hypothetical protein
MSLLLLRTIPVVIVRAFYPVLFKFQFRSTFRTWFLDFNINKMHIAGRFGVVSLWLERSSGWIINLILAPDYPMPAVRWTFWVRDFNKAVVRNRFP